MCVSMAALISVLCVLARMTSLALAVASQPVALRAFETGSRAREDVMVDVVLAVLVLTAPAVGGLSQRLWRELAPPFLCIFRGFFG